MSIIFTPGQLRRRAEFYFQLAQLISAGFGVVPALQHLLANTRLYRSPLQKVLLLIEQGHTLNEALRSEPGWLAEMDLALIQAGELSGRLEQSFRSLAAYYDERARMARQLLADLAYPAFLFHFAIFLLPFASFFTTGDLGAYLKATLGILVPCYVVIALVLFAGQGTHGQTWRALWERLLNMVPILGTARRELILSRLAAALEALLSAGVSIVEAWPMAAAASSSPAMQREVGSWRPQLASGSTPAEMVRSSPLFPELFSSHYATGEMSGSLDEQLGRLHRYYGDSGMRTLRNFSTWLPRLFYITVVFLIAWRVLKFWSGYFQNISNVLSQ